VGMSKRSYVEAVLKGLRSITSVDVDFIPHCEDSKSLFSSVPAIGHVRKRIYVRLLLSIDRRETAEAAMETVRQYVQTSNLKHLKAMWWISMLHFFGVGEACTGNEAIWGGWN